MPGGAILKRFTALLCLWVLAAPLSAEERVDLDMVTRIRQEGLRNSKVMETASELVDRIGPRLTGSPQMKAANEWTKTKLAEWGMANAHLESWGPFGRGWTYEACSIRMITPAAAQLLALPEAWTPGTNGPVRARAVRVSIKAKEDLEKLKGTLAGKVVFFGEPRDVRSHDKPDSVRYDEKGLTELYEYEIPGKAPRYDRAAFRKLRELRKEADKFFAEEKVLGLVLAGRGDLGTFGVQSGGSWRKGDPPGLTALAMESEHFGRIARLLDRGVEVEIEMDVKARFIEEDLMQWNTIAEIPGTDRKDEVVMIGAHLDSWHGGTGATDNAAGSVVAMEAMRILKAVGARPRRTIRIGLWSGEEQGVFGSRAYVAQHYASRPEPTPEEKDRPYYLRKKTGPLTLKPEHAKFSAYFNLDNGTGRIRGVYAQDNAGVVPIFEAWLAPLRDLGATLVTMNTTGSTDHESFDEVGLPGFQFVQDVLEYETRTHHTTMDLYERLQKEDLMQASVVMAVFAYQAAVRDGLLPRKPLPKDEPAKEEKKPEADPAHHSSRDAGPSSPSSLVAHAPRDDG